MGPAEFTLSADDVLRQARGYERHERFRGLCLLGITAARLWAWGCWKRPSDLHLSLDYGRI